MTGGLGPRDGAGPTVSVVIPTLQRREFVCRAAASVLAQTYRDFELIVVDDGSTDGTEAALASLDDRIHYEWQENRGVSAARNAGLRLSRGDIVAFLDSDNRWLPDHLAVVTKLFARHSEAVLVSTCPSFRIAGRAAVGQPEVTDLLPRLLLSNPVGFVSCIAVRREAVLSLGGFDERLPVWEDSDLWLRMSMCGPFCLLAQRTIEHSSTPGGLKERGIRTGEYVQAIERSAQNAVKLIRASTRPDAPELIRRARAKVLLVRAIRAVTRHDDKRAAEAFAQAAGLLPELSRRPGVVLVLLEHLVADRNDLLGSVAGTATLWPDQSSDTVRFLWGYAFVLAVRAGRVRQAVTYLVRSNALIRPDFIVRTWQLSRLLLRESRHARSGSS